MSKEIEVTPCPFCNHPKQELHCWQGPDSPHWNAYVECYDCGSKGPTKYVSPNLNAPDLPDGWKGSRVAHERAEAEVKKRAIDAWNERPTQPQESE